jgi:hypothetical protein
MWVCRYLCCVLTYIPLDICLGMVWEDYTIVLLLVLRGTSILISIVAGLIYIPTKSVWGFLSPFISYLHQNLLVFFFLMIAILNYVRWNLRVILFEFFMAKEVECLFMYLFVICSSCENHLLISFVQLLIGLFHLLVFYFLSSFYSLDFNPLSDE